MIHPTAVIDPDACIDPDATIGAYVCVEGPVNIGPGCVVEAHATLTGDVRMGVGNRVGHGALIGGWPQDRAFDPATASGVRIGAGNIIREHCTIHRGTAAGSMTVIGDGCFLMAGSHVGHNARLGDQVVLANNVLLGGYVEMGNSVFAGGGSVFHQFVRVGRHAMTQGNSAFSQDLPPFVIGAEVNRVHGLNVVGLRRGGFSPGERAEIKRAFKLLYTSGLNVGQALAASREQPWGAAAAEFFEFAATAKKRGLSGYRRRSTPPADE